MATGLVQLKVTSARGNGTAVQSREASKMHLGGCDKAIIAFIAKPNDRPVRVYGLLYAHYTGLFYHR